MNDTEIVDDPAVSVIRSEQGELFREPDTYPAIEHSEPVKPIMVPPFQRATPDKEPFKNWVKTYMACF
jgi:hypothetical protein